MLISSVLPEFLLCFFLEFFANINNLMNVLVGIQIGLSQSDMRAVRHEIGR